jgi:hypothetical protein
MNLGYAWFVELRIELLEELPEVPLDPVVN